MQLAEMVSNLESKVRELYRTESPSKELREEIFVLTAQIVLETHRIESRLQLMFQGH